jgi:hypothetical protein
MAVAPRGKELRIILFVFSIAARANRPQVSTARLYQPRRNCV